MWTKLTVRGYIRILSAYMEIDRALAELANPHTLIICTLAISYDRAWVLTRSGLGEPGAHVGKVVFHCIAVPLQVPKCSTVV
jgi:hypothetical protein